MRDHSDPAAADPSGELYALIGSRICHDLISPIGAIGNGVELLMMDGAAQSPEIALIAESVAHAAARIRFYRVAFGATGADQRISGRDVSGILAEMTRGGRLSIDWPTAPDLSRREVKLLFLGLLCLESALPLGGQVTVRHAEAGWRIAAESIRLRVDPGLWAHLEAKADMPPGDVGPAQVHFPLLALEVQKSGRRLAIHRTGEQISLTF